MLKHLAADAPRHIDWLADRTRLDAGSLADALFTLELKGLAAAVIPGTEDNCLVDIMNSQVPVIGIPIATALSVVLAGTSPATQIFNLLAPGSGLRGVALNRDPGDGAAAGAFGTNGLSYRLTDQQEALLGCGPFYGTNCDLDGIDLFNAEASVLVQAFPWLFVIFARKMLAVINDKLLEGATSAESISWAKLLLAGPLFLVVAFGVLFWAVRALKATEGRDLLIQGSSEVIHTLLANDLIDQLTILTFPVILGRGKRLFDEGSRPHAWALESSDTSTTGVIAGTYRRAGEVPTGSFAVDNPSAAELERRERWAREG